jgi:NAD(P)H dehydrogenase (quinone)
MELKKIKALIVYYSATGANYQLAQWAEEASNNAGAETRLRKVDELAPESAINKNEVWKKLIEKTRHVTTATLEDLEWADVIIFSAPTRYGNLPSQMKQFLDSTGPIWEQGKLANKIVTAMSSAMNPHGGQEATILNLYTTMFHWGAIVVAPGYTDQAITAAGGNPYGTSVTVSKTGEMKEDVKQAVFHQAKRAVMVALWMKKGSHNNEFVNEKELDKELTEAR